MEINDPQDEYEPNLPSETLLEMKAKEIKLFGEFRTRWLVLEAWDRLEWIEPAPAHVPATPDEKFEELMYVDLTSTAPS